ncbi:PREDICTED: rho GTPase-activating protein 22-like [Dipodomys ordii]|uniref:Rho GTPase-activating protein 22-like n=1 Tax=Dipodomys ordii TaxID=10020 RepID=A0A1S3GLR4_DIPOR|nr:PREDICTED: rho GTPase-activating protein 22-like [Dipodomys ordii]
MRLLLYRGQKKRIQKKSTQIASSRMSATASSKRKTFAARYFTRSKSLVMGEQSRSPGRPLQPSPVLKAGWLRKQRSIMKNWQQRWFVLRGDHLFYYKDKDEAKPQGFISLQGTQVTEFLPDPEDPGKHLFEITPAVFQVSGIDSSRKIAINGP